MGAIVARPHVSTHQDSILTASDRRKPKAAKALIDSEGVSAAQNVADKAEFLAFLDQVRIRAGMSVKEMAYFAGVPEGPFSEAFRGVRGNFAAHWADRQPTKFKAIYHRMLGERYGLSPETHARVQVERMVELHRLLLEGFISNGRIE